MWKSPIWPFLIHFRKIHGRVVIYCLSVVHPVQGVNLQQVWPKTSVSVSAARNGKVKNRYSSNQLISRRQSLDVFSWGGSGLQKIHNIHLVDVTVSNSYKILVYTLHFVYSLVLCSSLYYRARHAHPPCCCGLRKRNFAHQTKTQGGTNELNRNYKGGLLDRYNHVHRRTPFLVVSSVSCWFCYFQCLSVCNLLNRTPRKGNKI